MFPLQGGKIKQKIPLDNKDKLDKTFDNFKRLALAYEQYVNKAVERVKDIEDLQYLKVSTVENFENIFDNWDKFEAGMPASIKEIFRSSVSIRLNNETINITPEEFKRMTREIPLNMTAADYPVQTLEKILKNSNIKLDKVSTTVRKTKGQQFQDVIRANTVSEIVKDIVSESSQQKVHQEYFDKLIKEDAEQFYSIKANAETISDSADRKNILACYDYVIKYKKACIEGIRKTLDSYETKLKEFLIKLAQKSRDEDSYKKISTIMQSFVNYKNDPQAFLQIMFNMKANDKLKEKMQAKVNTVITEVRQGEAGQGYYNIDLKATTEQQLAKVFKLATQGIVDYINLDQGLLQQFSKQMKAIVPVDFTEIILDVFINYIMLCAIQFGNNTTVKFDLDVLNQDYDVFKSKSGLGLMMRAKNVLTILKNADANARAGVLGAGDDLNDDGEVIKRLIDDINANASAKTILGLAADIGNHDTPAQIVAILGNNNNDLLNKILDKLPELERVLQKSTSKNRTEYILYRMIDNMVKSIYGTIILIIQAHSKENQNIYTLLGSSRRRLQGGVQNGVECKSDCFSTYVLLYRLHKLFVYQATKIFFRKDYQYDNNAGALYGDAAANQEPTDAERKQIYSIIQITRTSKFYDLFKCLVAHGTDNGMGENFEEYFRCINALWEQVPGSTTGILSERAHNLLTQYVQELINNMIVTLQTLQNPNISDKVGIQDTFNRIESKSIDGINTFDRITNTEDYDTRIIVEERDKIKPDDVLELYMAINYQIQKFTEVYVEQHKDEYFQLQLYKDAILQELQSQKNIWLAKTEDQKKLYAANVDDAKFKKQYLVNLITADNLFESIKTGFDKYSKDFGLQYKQLKFIQLRIMDLLYSYHKQYVEKYNNITINADGVVGADANFNDYFLEAVKHLYTSTKDYVYQIFLLYNGVNPADVQRVEERNLSYRATQLIQNSEFVKMKIYMFFLEQLESKISTAIQAVAGNDNGQADINDYLTTDNIPAGQFNAERRIAKNLCKILIKLGVIEEYQFEEHKNAAYDKHQMPFMICFKNAAGAVFDPPKDDMQPKKTLAADNGRNQNEAWIYMIITKNFYNYFQQHNTYLKNFCVNELTEYTRSVEMLKCIPMLEIRDGEIDASKVYNFLTEAKNAVLEIYDKTNSIYTKQEIKDVIRHQLDLSLDIVPVLKDAFEKFVLPVQTYYNTIRYDLGRLDQGWFTSQEYKLHVYGLDEIKYQPLGHVKSLINKTSTGEDGQEVVNTTYKNCKLLAGKVQFRTNKIQQTQRKTEDYELDIVKTLNEKIAEVHDLLFQTYHTIPKEFRDKVLSNDVIRQSSELTDIQSGDTVFQLPLTSVQMPFQTEITSLDLSIKDQQTIIDNILNMNEVDKYMLNDEITYLTSAMMQFMQLTYGQNGSAYSQIPRPVKSQYINLFRKLFQQQTITDADLPQDFNWRNLFKRAIDGRDMLNDNNALAVARYGQANQQGVRPEVGALNTPALQRVFGKDNRIDWADWVGQENTESARFIDAINVLCRNQIRLIEALAFGVNGAARVEADNNDNKTIRRAGLTALIEQFTEFNLVNFLIGMTYYRKNVSSQIKKGLENLYIPENANWDNLRMVKAYNHQQVSYMRFDNSQGAYNALTGNINLQILHEQKTDARGNNGGKNEHYEFKFRSYAEYIQYLTNRIQQNAGRNQLQQQAHVNGGQVGQAAVEARDAVRNAQNEVVQPAVIAVGANDRLGINDDRYTQIDVEGNDKPFAVFTNQNLYRAFLVDLLKTVVLEFPAADRDQKLADFNGLVSQQNPIVIPMQIPTKKSIEDQTILQSAYAKGFVDSVSKIISDYHDKQELAVIYDQRTQKIELFDQATYTIEQTELPVLYMNNILALQDDQKEITNLSEERKIELTYDLIQKIRDLQTSLITVQDLQTPAVSIYNTYISACQNIVDGFMQKFDWNKFFDTKFDKRYFNLKQFLELDKVLRQSDDTPQQNAILATAEEAQENIANFANNIDVVRYKPAILIKFLNLILLKGINTLKAYDGKQLAGQVYKNFNYYLGIVGSGKYHAMIQNGNPAGAVIKNTQFMRLTFVKRLTSEKRIIGKDHYWAVADQIQILKDQTRFVPTNPAGDNEYYLPDWQTVLQGQRNYRNKVARKMLSYGSEYVDVLSNDLHVFDIRRIPYMQQYTSQPYVYNVIVDSSENKLQFQQPQAPAEDAARPAGVGQGRGGLRYLRGGVINQNSLDQLNAISQAVDRVVQAADAAVRNAGAVVNNEANEAIRNAAARNAATTISDAARTAAQEIARQNDPARNAGANDDVIANNAAVTTAVDAVATAAANAVQTVTENTLANIAADTLPNAAATAAANAMVNTIRDAARDEILDVAREVAGVQMRGVIDDVNYQTADMTLPQMTATLINALVGNELTRVRTVRDNTRNDLITARRDLNTARRDLNTARRDLNTAQTINTQYQQQNSINRGAINNNYATYAVIPQHLMDEMSMNTGLTNISTVNVAVQLTFDISKISDTLDTYLGKLKSYGRDDDANAANNIITVQDNDTRRQDYLTYYIEQFYTLRKRLSTTLNNQAVLRNVVISLFNDFLTDPVIFTYNIATCQNKHLSRLIDEYRQNNVANNMKLFNILDLQPFHPIQLIKDNSIYQIMTVFGIYVNKYNTLYASQNVLMQGDDNNTYKQLNHTTKYGQKIYIKYQVTAPEGVDENQILTNRRPVILHKDAGQNTVVYYKQQNGQDVIIRVEYQNNSKEIETHDQLQHLLDRHDMSQYGINIAAWNEQIIDSNLILGAKIVNAADAEVPNDAAALTVIKQFTNRNHTMYQLVKYNGIVLAGNNRNNIDVNLEANNKIPHLVLQIFDFIRHYNKLIQTNDATDKQGITYSQYHVVVTDENAANQIAYDQV